MSVAIVLEDVLCGIGDLIPAEVMRPALLESIEYPMSSVVPVEIDREKRTLSFSLSGQDYLLTLEVVGQKYGVLR